VSNVFQQFGAGLTAFEAPVDARMAFVRRTYVHLSAAIGLFVAASWALYASGFSEGFLNWIGQGRFNWLLVIGAFSILGWLGTSMAHHAQGKGLQYGGLTVYAIAQAVVFSPMLFIAARSFPGTHILETAAALTLVTFAGLSGYVLTTKKDFSFLGTFLAVAGLVVLGLIVVAVIFGLNLGIWFSAAMILFSAGTALYSTSKVLHTYRLDQHVAASLELFASIAMMFFYILRLLMQLQRR
jgi:FtsH-binding integral membrane protein